MGGRKVIYYAVEPVREAASDGPLGIASAAVVTCMATGRHLDGMGGGGLALSVDVVHALDMARTGGRPRVVCDAEVFDGLVAAARASLAGAADDPARAAALRDLLTRTEADPPGGS